MKNDMVLFELAYKEITSEFDLSHEVQLKNINGRYVFDKARWMWEAWQASASRGGYKLVPLEINDEIESAMFSSVARGEMPCEIYKAMIGAIE